MHISDGSTNHSLSDTMTGHTSGGRNANISGTRNDSLDMKPSYPYNFYTKVKLTRDASSSVDSAPSTSELEVRVALGPAVKPHECRCSLDLCEETIWSYRARSTQRSWYVLRLFTQTIPR